MSKSIPAPLVALVADLCAEQETHASLDSLFMYADATGDPPMGSKPIKECIVKYGLRYLVGGHILAGGMAPSKTLRELILGRDIPAIQ
ncbi:hypothetical protein SAMN05192560_2246 [Methylobacillus rhizosphaerae]|uniref:Uncharacterized protein n=1 Tax=Methylobacillus rhizosphaerae TaxID=551994 RepID=A0A239B176_9PROT|nr:hypothetical protein SAMN05192560_2246 [Methylobacillus rhizosphaerae]